MKILFSPTDIKFDKKRLLDSFESVKNIAPGARLERDIRWYGWALTNTDGSDDDGLWGHHITTEMLDEYKRTMHHPDRYFYKKTRFYNHFSWILEKFPVTYRARIICTPKDVEEQKSHRDGVIYRLFIPIIPAQVSFLKTDGEDYQTAFDTGRVYIINGKYEHKPLVDEQTNRIHLMWSMVPEDLNKILKV